MSLSHGRQGDGARFTGPCLPARGAGAVFFRGGGFHGGVVAQRKNEVVQRDRHGDFFAGCLAVLLFEPDDGSENRFHWEARRVLIHLPCFLN